MSLEFSPSNYLAVLSKSGEITISNCQNPAVKLPFYQFGKRGFGLAWDPSGDHLAAIGATETECKLVVLKHRESNVEIVWETRLGDLKENDLPRNPCWSPNGTQLFFACPEKGCRYVTRGPQGWVESLPGFGGRDTFLVVRLSFPFPQKTRVTVPLFSLSLSPSLFPSLSLVVSESATR